MQDWVKRKIIAEKCIAPIIKRTETQSGIYLYEREDEKGIHYFYCGLAKNLYERQISHWNGYQRIDISMRKRGFYNKENPFGWKFTILQYCDIDKLEEEEQKWILFYTKLGYQTYNLNYGGNKGKTNTFDKERKGYNQGVKQGYQKALKEIKVYFEKYLDFIIKGKTNQTKERKLKEFENLLNNGEN